MLKRKKRSQKLRIFLAANQDIVARLSKAESVRLKYVIYTFRKFLEKYSDEEANRLAAASQRQH